MEAVDRWRNKLSKMLKRKKRRGKIPRRMSARRYSTAVLVTALKTGRLYTNSSNPPTRYEIQQELLKRARTTQGG